MLHPAYVRVEEVAQIRHAIFQHGDAVDSNAPGKALILIRVEAAIFQHVRVHHAAAEDFHPVCAFAELHFVAGAVTLNVHFQRRFCEREEGRAKTHLYLPHLTFYRQQGLPVGGTLESGSHLRHTDRSCQE